MKKFLVIVALVAAALPAYTQTLEMTASKMQDGSAPLTGRIEMAPVLSGGTPTYYHTSGGGLSTVTAISYPVTAGAFTIPVIADSALTVPANLCWRTTFFRANGSVVASIPCVQPSASNSWFASGVDNFDNWLPSIAALPMYGSGITIGGFAGPFVFTGAGVSCNFTTLICTFGGGGSMTWPSVAGIANYAGSNAWGASYNSSNQIPASWVNLSGYTSTASLGSAAFQPASAFDAAGVGAADASAAIGTAESVAASLYAPRSGATFTGPLAATSTVDFSGSSAPMKVPVIAGCTTTASGQECHDSTNHNWHDFDNGVDNIVLIFPSASPPTSGHAAGFLKTGNVWTAEDLGLLGSAAFDAASTFDAAGAAATAQAAAIAASDTAGAATTALASAETFSANASNISGGTLNHARLPTLLSGDIPNNAANTSGAAANLSGTPTLPTGTSAATGTAGESDTNVATNAQVANASWLWVVSAGTGITVPANTVTTPDWQTPGGSLSFVTTSTNHEIGFGLSGTVRNLTVCINTTQPSGGALVVTVALSATIGVSTPSLQTLTVSIPSGTTAGCYSDLTHSFTYTATAAGPGVTYQLTNAPSSSASAAILSISLALQNPH